MIDKLFEYKKYIIVVGLLLCLSFFAWMYKVELNKNNDTVKRDNVISLNSVTTTSKEYTFYVDVKGAVKKPSVYSFKDGDKVIDAIKKAGGLTKNATTSNINLSQKLKNEMVIYIFTKTELKESSNKDIVATTNVPCKCETIEVNNCVEPKKTIVTTTKVKDTTTLKTNDNDNDNTKFVESNLININTAGVSELTSLSGIGESKAKSIIEYREENGLFNKIEDIMNVSGLGEALFDKIKNFITV